jgi:hypothetical protein
MKPKQTPGRDGCSAVILGDAAASRAIGAGRAAARRPRRPEEQDEDKVEFGRKGEGR